MKNNWLILLLLGVLAYSACEKVVEEPSFSTTPAIKLLEVSQDTIKEFTDRIILKIAYEDGDGDLGNPDPDINTIFVKDRRLAVADEYFLGPLAPIGEKISIKGELELQLSQTFLLGNGQVENTVYTIHFVDRAGHESNVIETSPITILKD